VNLGFLFARLRKVYQYQAKRNFHCGQRGKRRAKGGEEEGDEEEGRRSDGTDPPTDHGEEAEEGENQGAKGGKNGEGCRANV
jgi:hypothetical protein